MDGDVLQQVAVAPQCCEFYVLLGAQAVEARRFQEFHVLLFDQEVVQVILGRKRHRRGILPDVSFDARRILGPGHRHAVVAVAHKVGVAHPVQFYRRQPPARNHLILDCRPALTQFVAPWQKRPCKVLIASYAAHNLIERDLLQPAKVLVAESQLLANLLEGQKVR